MSEPARESESMTGFMLNMAIPAVIRKYTATAAGLILFSVPNILTPFS
jgi:hypothetical protein